MSAIELKGHSKVTIENPTQAIRDAFIAIPDAFNRKVNAQTNRKVITNIPTQLLGNRLITCEVTLARGDNRVIVSLEDFMPSRNPESGQTVKGLAGNVYSDYRTGNLPDDKIATREFYALLAYFAGCMLTGMLPTPVKPSGQSTIMSEFIRSWTTSQKLEVESVAVVGGNGNRMVYTAEDFQNVYNAFQSNAKRILDGWQDREGRGGSKAGKVEWV